MNVQKSLRLLHKNHERQEIEKQRANDEVARLKKSVTTSNSRPEYSKDESRYAPQAQKLSKFNNATVTERKKQMAKLVEMGVAVPEEYRAELAMAGDWRAVSEAQPGLASVNNSEVDESKTSSLTKRKHTNEKQDAFESDYNDTGKNKWGSTIKQYPGWHEDEDIDLITGTELSLVNEAAPVQPKVKNEIEEDQTAIVQEGMAAEQTEVTGPNNSVMFKKRKKKVKT